MIQIGLSSASCLTRSPLEHVRLAVAAGLDGVEWADIRLDSSGLEKNPDDLLMLTLRSGLSVFSYAANLRAPTELSRIGDFSKTLEIATSLQSPNIRIFAGNFPSRNHSNADRIRLADELERIGDAAEKHGITVCLSFARNTCLDDYESASLLIDEVDHPFVRLAWEPLSGESGETATSCLEAEPDAIGLVLTRKSPPKDAAIWKSRIQAYRRSEKDPDMNRFVLIDGDGANGEQSLKAEASFLRGIIAGLPKA